MATESKGGHGSGATVWGFAVITICAAVIVLAVIDNLHPERDRGFVPLSGEYAGYQAEPRRNMKATRDDYRLVEQVYKFGRE